MGSACTFSKSFANCVADATDLFPSTVGDIPRAGSSGLRRNAARLVLHTMPTVSSRLAIGRPASGSTHFSGVPRFVNSFITDGLECRSTQLGRQITS
jgi:hypothetical protein